VDSRAAERQVADSRSRGGKDGVANCRRRRCQWWFTKSGGAVVALDELNLYLWRLADTQQLVIAEVALLSGTIGKRYLEVRGTQCIHEATFDLVPGAAQVDDRPAINGGEYFLDLYE
jgi:hypothetical protein